MAHGPLMVEGKQVGPDPRAGACTAAECTCRAFWGEPYYEHTYSDVLLIFTLKALLPDKYRESIEVRDAHVRIDWKQLAAQPGGQAIIARLAAGEDYRIVLAGILERLVKAGIVAFGPTDRKGLPPATAPAD